MINKLHKITIFFCLIFATLLGVATLFLSSCTNSERVKIGALNGPTSISLAYLFDAYDIEVLGQADAVVSKIASEEVDIALIPSNVAKNIYEKNNNIKLIDVNTLGVLHAISSDGSLNSVEKLKGRKIYLTGKGSVPEQVVNKQLSDFGMTSQDVELIFCSEASEVIARVQADSSSVGIVNEPQASIACKKYPNLYKTIDLTENVVTGVAVVRQDYLENNNAKVNQFLQDHEESISKLYQSPDEAVSILSEYTSFDKEYLLSSINNCNIKFFSGQDAKIQLNNYFQYIGVSLPEDDFYYLP